MPDLSKLTERWSTSSLNIQQVWVLNDLSFMSEDTHFTSKLRATYLRGSIRLKLRSNLRPGSESDASQAMWGKDHASGHESDWAILRGFFTQLIMVGQKKIQLNPTQHISSIQPNLTYMGRVKSMNLTNFFYYYY